MTVGGWNLPSPGFCTLLGTPSEGLQPFPQAGMAPLHWPLMSGLVGPTPGTAFSGYPSARQQRHLPDPPGMSSPCSWHPDPGAPAAPPARMASHATRRGSCFNLGRINLH